LDNIDRALEKFWFLPAAACAALLGWHIWQWYFLSDDAFISFRYALHLTQGHGLVWNPGEPVEGYTNFLWVLLMALSMILGVPVEYASNAISILCGVGVLVLLFRFAAARLSLTFTWALILVLCSSRSFAAWCTSGLETMFYTLLVFIGLERYLFERANVSRVAIQSSLALALASLTRPDGGLFMFAVGLFFLFDILRGRRSLISGVIWALPYLLIVGGHLAWRLDYYGYLLPNTFYAKVNGLWLTQAVKYFTLFNDYYNIVWLLPLCLLPLYTRRRYEYFFLATVTAIYLVYLTFIGGDRFEFRFLVVVFPYFYFLLVSGIEDLQSVLPKRAGIAVSIALVLLLLGTTLYGSIHKIGNRNRYGIASLQLMKNYAEDRAEQGKFLRSLIDEGLLPEDTVISVGGAGALPYYSRMVTVDRRGLSDIHIAHTPIEDRGRVAHEHDAPAEYLRERKVVMFDIFNQLVQKSPGRLNRNMEHDGEPVKLRAVKAKDRYLVFATYVSDEELGKTFSKLRLITPSGE